MVRVAGVDGCRGGWFRVLVDWQEGQVRRYQGHMLDRIDQLLALLPQLAAVAIDMPIGLYDRPRVGGRDCDRAARKYLGKRGVCVFSPPARSLINAKTFEEVRGRGMTVQGFHLIPKIRELDHIMNPRLQEQWIEAHPECAFTRLAGVPLKEPKRTAAGRARRVALLRPIFPDIDRWLVANRRTGVAGDDMLDALVLTWVAYRFVQGTAEAFPDHIERDASGLAMQIWH